MNPTPHLRQHRDQSRGSTVPGILLLPLALWWPLQRTPHVYKIHHGSNTIFLLSAFLQCMHRAKSFCCKRRGIIFINILKQVFLFSSNRLLHSPKEPHARHHFVVGYKNSSLGWPLPLTSSLSLTDTRRLESEAVADARDPLRPSSRFSLLASVSITAAFSLKGQRQVKHLSPDTETMR